MAAFYLYLSGSILLTIASAIAIRHDRTLVSTLYLGASILFTIGGCLLVWGPK